MKVNNKIKINLKNLNHTLITLRSLFENKCDWNDITFFHSYHNKKKYIIFLFLQYNIFFKERQIFNYNI